LGKPRENPQKQKTRWKANEIISRPENALGGL